MRIIRGHLGGRTIPFPKHFKSRATTDVAKESLFNILDSQLDYSQIRVLDLFAGTGNISYEFASRGCTAVVAVEKNGKNVAFIRQTLANLGLSGVTIKRYDALKYLQNAEQTFHAIFADPPFDASFLAKLPQMILNSGRLKHGGLLVVEHDKRHNFGELAGFIEQRRYGHVVFSFFQYEKNTD